MSDPRLIYIEWEDSCLGDGWEWLSREKKDEPLICKSIGWLLLDGENTKIVSPHLADKDSGGSYQGSGVMTIPVRAIVRMVEIPPISEA